MQLLYLLYRQRNAVTIDGTVLPFISLNAHICFVHMARQFSLRTCVALIVTYTGSISVACPLLVYAHDIRLISAAHTYVYCLCIDN